MDLRQRMADWLMHARGNRRRAHEYKRLAMEYRAAGNDGRFYECKVQSDRSWRLAWHALNEAKLNRELLHV